MAITTLPEGNLKFNFPSGWLVCKFDSWSFYRNQFMKLGEARIPCPKCGNEVLCGACGHRKVAGTKGVDFLAIDGDITWYIEVKDYRRERRTKTIDLADEFALKVRDSIAAVVAAKANATVSQEKDIAAKALTCGKLRLVLHLEQPAKHSTLFPRAIDPANVELRLKQLVKAFDAHPLVIDKRNMRAAKWTVT